MTALAARRTPAGVTLGCDSTVRITYPDGVQLDGYSAVKIARVQWGAVAGAGDLSIVQDLRDLAAECSGLVEFSARARRHRGSWEAIATDGTTIATLCPGEVTTAEDYATAGTGGPVALGALAAGASVRRALEIAGALCSGVGGRIVTVRVRRGD